MLYSPDSLQWPVPPKGFLNWRDAPDMEPEKSMVARYQRVDGDFPVAKEALLEPSQSLHKSLREKWLYLGNKQPDDSDVEIEKFIYEAAAPKHYYYPTDLPELFMTFIKIDPNKLEILKFAEQHGRLGMSENYFSGERLSAWVTEIVCLRHVYRLWCALKSQNADTLAHLHRLWVQRHQDKAESVQADDLFRRLHPEEWQSAINVPSAIATLPSEMIVWTEIGNITNDALQQHGLVLQCELNLNKRIGTTDDSGLITRFAPKTLIATLWLQFFELTIEPHWKVCDYCGKPFKAKSKKRKYCTPSHNQMAYLKREQAKK